MSSNSGRRRSMDDVLSSIRRIIGADKQSDDEYGSGADKYHVPPLDETGGQPPDLQPVGGHEAEDPLPLTPGMRSAGPEDRGGDEAIPMPVRDEAQAPAEGGGGGDAMVIDEAALEDMIRRIVRDELEQLENDEAAMRRIVHEELTGEIGQRISDNVRRMIRDEVSRLMRDPG
jgi:hypothetical protein